MSEGGIGRALPKIIRSYPHIEGINFDLPHAVATAPACSGVTDVGGDMFDTIAHGDALFMKVSFIARQIVYIY